MLEGARDRFSLREGDADVALLFRVASDWRRPDARDGGWNLYWRSADGYGQILPRPTPDEVTRFYDLAQYYTHGTDQGVQARRTLGWRLLESAASRFEGDSRPPRRWWSDLLGEGRFRVVEIGCGHGQTLALLAEEGHDVFGVEPDPVALAEARKRGIEVSQATAESLPPELAPEIWDVVLMSHVLEHCVDPALALENAAGLLRPGGRLVVEVPNNDCEGFRRFGDEWYWLDVPRHLNFFTRSSLEGLIETVGLEVEAVEFRGYWRQICQEWAGQQANIRRAYGRPPGTPLASQTAYFLKTFRAPPENKFDSLRIVARKQPTA
ncbi:class I SAM-dependent methyltransferase [Albimonas sp. CAU 1670]|uniref:class I SAM-dependent methyltransferase n=1 Tax=Albimonas sp. CAU 1670 TaxID=3032599 RepID=UPI0023D98E2D|nr:class I SAM-dependent methyltransferase [Albimonas sp. CAU 1670]MDF2231014.1 class I SAM-dependent methyltransferase [Albimonas sp. CAU 1670]